MTKKKSRFTLMTRLKANWTQEASNTEPRRATTHHNGAMQSVVDWLN